MGDKSPPAAATTVGPEPAEHGERLIDSQILAGTWSPRMKADYVERDVPTIAQLADEHYPRKIRRACGLTG